MVKVVEEVVLLLLLLLLLSLLFLGREADDPVNFPNSLSTAQALHGWCRDRGGGGCLVGATSSICL